MHENRNVSTLIFHMDDLQNHPASHLECQDTPEHEAGESAAPASPWAAENTAQASLRTAPVRRVWAVGGTEAEWSLVDGPSIGHQEETSRLGESFAGKEHVSPAQEHAFDPYVRRGMWCHHRQGGSRQIFGAYWPASRAYLVDFSQGETLSQRTRVVIDRTWRPPHAYPHLYTFIHTQVLFHTREFTHTHTRNRINRWLFNLTSLNVDPASHLLGLAIFSVQSSI